MKVLVTGGAGYIGSHTCKYLARNGNEVTVYDNLSTGHKELVRWGDFVHGDIRDESRLRAVIHRVNPDGIIHFASSISVGESVVDPGSYYENNVLGSLRIMQCLRDEGVRPLVVSGSAAVYGLPDNCPVCETEKPMPINPYGRTKLIMEWMLKDFAKAHALPWVALRYFNAAGADPEGETGEWHEPETHLIPNVLRSVAEDGNTLKVFGTDYKTKDGTCIRDYVHVCDLASAHALALEYLLNKNKSTSINLGNGKGISVKEIISTVEKVTGKRVKFEVCDRRPGDPKELVADSKKARQLLNWEPRYESIESIIKTAWDWNNKLKNKAMK
ncbi:MAG: UDP-glucose 4-epimerase GalE [Desulfovibrio sp.]|nr:UDP-glucose 4-epimerase GalE [Desulfovibrio sp.]